MSMCNRVMILKFLWSYFQVRRQAEKMCDLFGGSERAREPLGSKRRSVTPMSRVH